MIEKWSRPAASTMSTGAPSARHAAARSFVCRWYSGPSSPEPAGSPGRHRRVLEEGGEGRGEGGGDEGEVGLVGAVPVAAVDEDMQGGGAGPGGEPRP